jgi:hypothetical protein
LFDTSLLAEALDHLRNQGAVVPHHLVFECGSDQLSLGECAGVRVIEKALKMTLGKDVGSDAAGHDHRRRDAECEANCRAGKTQLHNAGTKMAG